MPFVPKYSAYTTGPAVSPFAVFSSFVLFHLITLRKSEQSCHFRVLGKGHRQMSWASHLAKLREHRASNRAVLLATGFTVNLRITYKQFKVGVRSPHIVGFRQQPD